MSAPRDGGPGARSGPRMEALRCGPPRRYPSSRTAPGSPAVVQWEQGDAERNPERSK